MAGETRLELARNLERVCAPADTLFVVDWLIAHRDAVLEALGGELEGEQGFNDWSYWRFPRD